MHNSHSLEKNLITALSWLVPTFYEKNATCKSDKSKMWKKVPMICAIDYTNW